MRSKWEFHSPFDSEPIKEMMDSLHIPRSVARVLYNRGLIERDTVKRFLEPKISNLHDPFLLRDMNKAVDRIIQALREREQILIYGDYDVDGITSVSLLYLFLKDLGGFLSYYIPDRITEGYGISVGGIDAARKEGCSLIITVDCGITSIKEVEVAKEYGIDVIITDHHEPGESVPDALAVIDPKRQGCDYPFKELAGVGVAFKLSQGILAKLDMETSYVEKYLDLVAIGSAADIVPLVDENRIFVSTGLEKLNSDGLEGVMTLVETAGFRSGKIEVSQIIYGLAPRINAVGRLGSATPAVELLITRNHMQAQTIARKLEKENQKRKEIDNRTLQEAISKLEGEFDPDSDTAIVLAGENWHPGVIGIVASRLIERYFKPTVMISVENGIGKGSARSIPNFDLHSALKACSDLFVQFGGHKYAAGLTIDAANIPKFKDRFNKITSEILTSDDLIPRIYIDDELHLSEIDHELIRMLNTLSPFGPRNPRPNYTSEGVEIVGEPRVVGDRHLKFRVRQGDTIIEAIAFNMGDQVNRVREQRIIDLVYTIEENHWMDRKTIQLRVKDIH